MPAATSRKPHFFPTRFWQAMALAVVSVGLGTLAHADDNDVPSWPANALPSA